tara:strand:- start:1351 stop:2028 length:678 start_codon:yes stop_codon:yes gene_type:complete
MIKKKFTAFILCGGKGTRYNINKNKKILKPLVKINKKTILERIIELYSKNGIDRFVLLGGYKINTLKSFIKKKLKNYDITILNTGLNTETGGRLLFVKKLLSNDTFLFTYGDSLTNFNLNKALKLKKSNNIVMSYYYYDFQYGVLKKKGKILKKIIEKNNHIPINAGFYVLDNKIFKFIKNKNDSFEKKVLPKVLKSKYKIILNRVTKWYPMDNLKDKKEMELNL